MLNFKQTVLSKYQVTSEDGFSKILDNDESSSSKPAMADNAHQRIKKAAKEAEAAFWESVAKQFPEIKTGDFHPLQTHKMQLQMEEWIRQWVNLNSEEVAHKCRYCGKETDDDSGVCHKCYKNEQER